MIWDLTGEIYTGMWNYEPPFPEVEVKPLPKVDWVKTEVYCDIFAGLHSQSGTYLETPMHLLGDASYPLGEVPIEKLVGMDAVVLQLPAISPNGTRSPITREMLEVFDIPEGVAVLVSTGWGRFWKEPFYLNESPYFTYDAVEYLVSQKPFLLGTDFPRWENLEHPQGFFPMFYDGDILMLAPCINLEKLPTRGKLTALPLRVDTTCCAPARAVFEA